MSISAHRLSESRLELIPATAALVRAEMECGRPFFHMLGVQPVDGWPPVDTADALPFFLEQLQKGPEMEGWLAWYWVLTGKSGEESVLVGNGGFKGPPSSDGIVEVGYYVRPAHRGHGYGTEAVCCLLEHALSRAGVKLVIAQTQHDNEASVKLLEKVGFVCAGEGCEPGLLRFEIARSQASDKHASAALMPLPARVAPPWLTP